MPKAAFVLLLLLLPTAVAADNSSSIEPAASSLFKISFAERQMFLVGYISGRRDSEVISAGKAAILPPSACDNMMYGVIAKRMASAMATHTIQSLKVSLQIAYDTVCEPVE